MKFLEENNAYLDWAISRDLYTHSIIDDKEITDIKNNYDYCQNCDNGKDKDDYEIEL